MYESALPLDNSLVARALAVVSRSPAGVITDIDGTISPIVPLPSEARVLPRAAAALTRLAALLPVVAVVTGRRVPDAQRMVGVPDLVYIGNHGLEYASAAGPVYAAEAEPYVPLLEQALAEITLGLKTPGILVENKGLTASLHYRLAPHPLPARQEIVDAIAASRSASLLVVEHGRLVVNLLPPVRLDKGTAVRTLVEEHGLRGVVYLGDDCTDVHAFHALDALRAEGVATLELAVGTSEGTIDVRAEAEAVLPSVPAAADFLWELADALSSHAQRVAGAPERA